MKTRDIITMLAYMALSGVAAVASSIFFYMLEKSDFYGAVILSIFFFAFAVLKALTMDLKGHASVISPVLESFTRGMVQITAAIGLLIYAASSVLALQAFWVAVVILMFLAGFHNVSHSVFLWFAGFKQKRKERERAEMERKVEAELALEAQKAEEEKKNEERLLADLGNFLSNTELPGERGM